MRMLGYEPGEKSDVRVVRMARRKVGREETMRNERTARRGGRVRQVTGVLLS